MDDPELEQVADRLDAVAEELADLVLAELRRAAAAGESGRSARERRLGRARRSVEKAAHLLRGADPGS